MIKYPKLFEPLAIGDTVFRNRIFAAPRGYYNVAKDNLPGEAMAAYFERGAIGGFASVCVGDCIVEDETGTHYPFLLRMEDTSTLPGLSHVADMIRRHGAVASAELSHAGQYAQFVKEPGRADYGPENLQYESDLPGGTLYGPMYIEHGKYGEVEAMPEEIILRIIGKFGSAAAWAKRCGFNMVTIHGGHGWLLAQFMSPFANRRTDRWGGSFENRMRFTLAAVESVRRAVGPRFPIEFRMSGDECCEGGYDISEGVKIAKALDGKVDIIHVSTGNHEDKNAFLVTHPSIFMQDGANVRFAAEIKKHVKTPVATVGALTDPAHMEEIIASGQADIVELGRQSLADPDLPNKARRGDEDEIDKCLRCCECFAGAGQHRTPRCAINPEIGQEIEAKFEAPPRVKKRVLVAGGGVGGMQAAISAAQRGHEVLLFEKTDRLGGVLLCEHGVPFKEKLGMYLERQAMRIKKLGVSVSLSTEVTPELVRSIAPDAVICALGARPVKPPIDGIDGKSVLGAEQAYKEPQRVGESAVILGGGLVGLELAIYLKMLGKSVTVIEMQPKPTLGTYSTHGAAILGKIAELEIPLMLETRALQIIETGVLCEKDGEKNSISAETVIYATGQKALRYEAFALSGCAPEFHMLGDCVTPENILRATRLAYTAAKDLGKG